MPDIDVHRVNKAIEQIYLAGLDRHRWRGFVEYIAQGYPGAGVALLGHDLDGRRDLGLVTAGFDPEAVASFESYYGAINPWSEHIARAPVGTALESDALLSRDVMMRTEFYADWLRPQDNMIGGVGTLAQSDGQRFLFFNFTLPEGVDARYHEELVLLCDLMGPHLRHAVEMTRRLAGSEMSEVRLQSFEQTPAPVFTVSAVGAVCAMNSRAESLLSAGGIVRRSAADVLHFVDPTADVQLARALDVLRRMDFSAPPVPFAVRAPSAETDYLVTIAPYVPDMDVVAPAFSFLIEDRPIAVLLMTPSPAQDSQVLDAILTARGLTPAERALALAVFRGNSLQTFADERKVSIHTARNQLRAIYDKLEVRRQSELAVLMGRLAGLRTSE